MEIKVIDEMIAFFESEKHDAKERATDPRSYGDEFLADYLSQIEGFIKALKDEKIVSVLSDCYAILLRR